MPPPEFALERGCIGDQVRYDDDNQTSHPIGVKAAPLTFLMVAITASGIDVRYNFHYGRGLISSSAFLSFFFDAELVNCNRDITNATLRPSIVVHNLVL